MIATMVKVVKGSIIIIRMEEANINILPRSLPRKTTSPGFRPAPPQGEREHLSRLGGIVGGGGGGGEVVGGGGVGGGGGASQDREQTPSRGDTAWGHGRRSGNCFQCQMGILSY